MNKRVLFVNHGINPRCGVYQEGKRIGRAIEMSSEFSIKYVQLNSIHEYTDLINSYNPIAVIYNYYPSTLGWSGTGAGRFPLIKHIGICHEIELPDTFQYKILLDPSATDTSPVFPTVPGHTFKTGRCLLPYVDVVYPKNDIVTFGSFGFGFGNKGYTTLIKRVIDEFGVAKVRLHVPFAHFGDADGRSAREQADLCRELARDTGVTLEITHDFWDDDKLLSWLAGNDMNCFFYEEMYGRGISGCIDYALSVERPIAITDSFMFRHIRHIEPTILMERDFLHNILERGTAPLQQLKDAWINENLVKDYERILTEVVGA